MLVPKEFWSSIRRRAAECIESLITVAQSAKSEIPDLDTRGAGVEDIFCLQVSMDDVVFMLLEKKQKKASNNFILSTRDAVTSSNSIEKKVLR